MKKNDFKFLKILIKTGLFQVIPPPNPLIEFNDILNLIQRIINWLSGFAGLVAIIMIIWGAIQYLTAYGNEERAQRGKTTFFWSLIGVMLILLAWGLVNLIWVIIEGRPFREP